MNTNTGTNNSIARIANYVTRIENNNAVSNSNAVINNNAASSAKEQTLMNAFKSIVTRAAKTLGALALLSLAATAAVKADVIVDTNTDGSLKFAGPQGAYSDTPNLAVTPGMTVLQLKIHNTDPNYGVTGVKVQTYIYLDSDVNSGWTVRAMPALTNISLGPNQSEWFSIVIPNNDYRAPFQSLRGHHLYAKALIGTHTYWLNDFLDSSFDIDVQVASEVHNSDGTVSVTVEFTNEGHIASLAQSVSLSYMPYAEGNLWTSPGKTAAQTLVAFSRGQSRTLTFKTSSLSSLAYSYINGTVAIGSEESLSLRF